MERRGGRGLLPPSQDLYGRYSQCVPGFYLRMGVVSQDDDLPWSQLIGFEELPEDRLLPSALGFIEGIDDDAVEVMSNPKALDLALLQAPESRRDEEAQPGNLFD